MSNRTDFDALALELVEMFGLDPEADAGVGGRLLQRLELELRNAYVAGEEGSPLTRARRRRTIARMPNTPTTCAQLAAMLVAVRDTDHGSPECERAIMDLHDDNLVALEILCRLLPAETIVALERAGDRSLWIDRSPHPARDLTGLLRSIRTT